MDRQQTCKERVRSAYRSRMDDVRRLWALYRQDPDANTDDGENWNEYGLCWDYVPAGTFSDQRRGYFRFQVSCGGPSEEFRFYAAEDLGLCRVEFWFLDWFDGAKVTVSGVDLDCWREIWADLMECECPAEWIKKAKE